VALYASTDLLIIKLALILFVTGRYRTLQELGHFAIHGVLCPNRRWGMFLNDLFFQYPLFLQQSEIRRRIHVIEHHANTHRPGRDPDYDDLVRAGFTPGMSRREFWLTVLFPLTPMGILTWFRFMMHNALRENRHLGDLLLRCVSVGILVAVFAVLGLNEELVALYLIPLIVTYPLFQWLAHISEHRWFLSLPEGLSRIDRELALGRPFALPGLVGALVRTQVLPLGDSYHLAHSVLPHVRWNHLAMVDRVMTRGLPAYAEGAGRGLFFDSKGMNSAIGELYQRLVGSRHVESDQQWPPC
jgi:fatty acid desaturase